MRLVCLASGRGSNFAALADALGKGEIPGAEMVGLVSNKPAAPALEIARARGIPAVAVDAGAFRTPQGKLDRARYELELIRAVEAFRPDWICLAGYMLLVGPDVLRRWPHRIVNIHPSLLPSFKGLHAQRQAIEAGVRWAGCTVHLVDQSLDGGPIVEQSVVEVLPDDTEETLSARLLPVEHRTYVAAMRRLCTERFEVVGNRLRWLGQL